jgi:photosystem II stability/assembly factor-like uncharacterized protein
MRGPSPLRRRSWRLAAALAMLLATMLSPALAVKLELEVPATMTPLGLKRPLIGITEAGKRLVAVGRMGGIYLSEDAGKSWSQAGVPVSVDLTAVHFPSERQGWAVGHDGVVLRSTDGGRNWRLLLDGRRAATQMQAYYERQPASDDAMVAAALEESRRFAQEDGARPFLDVWFEDEKLGYVVGAWGLILRTQDGGESWEPWMHRTDNLDSLHLNAIRRVAGRLWIVGERGLMLRLDEAAGRFVAMASPNTGTYFGIAGADSTLLAYGLQGRAFRSLDAGESWQAIKLPTQGVIAAGDLKASGVALLGDSTGKLWLSRDGGSSFQLIDDERATPIFGLHLLDDSRVATVGMAGVNLQTLKPTAASDRR